MRPVLLASVFAALTGCSWFGSSGGDVVTPLEEFKAEADIRSLWSRDLGKGPQRRFLKIVPVLHRDLIFASDIRGHVQALNRETGKLQWGTELKLDVTAGVGFGDDLVFVGTRRGVLVALDKNNGKEQWRAQVSSEVLAPAVAESGVVVVQSVDGRLTGMASATGKTLWIVERSEPALSLRGTATPVIISGVVLTGFATGKLAAVSLRDGRVIWEIPVAQAQGRSEIERLVDVDVPVLVSGSTLVAAAYQGKIVALNMENGQLLWSREFSVYSALAADAANLYLSDARGQVYALDLRTGATVWKQDKLAGRKPSAPAVVGSAVAVGDFDGYVHWLAREDGRFLARHRMVREAILAAPVADGATLYVSAQNSELAALQIAPRAK